MLTDAEMQLVCLQALIEMKARAAAPDVARLLGSDSADVRAASIGALRALSAGEHAAQVLPLAEDREPAVRKAAREALAAWDQRVQAAAASSGIKLDQLLVRMARDEGDDLLVAPGRAIFAKVRGQVLPMTKAPLTPEHVEALLAPLLHAEHKDSLAALRDVDCPYEVKAEGLRFRAHLFQQSGGLAAVFRRIRGQLIDFDALGLPAVVRGFGELKNGLVLVGGPTGSGKSTTLAALIDLVNRTSARHIVSLEDPIEVIHPHKKSLVNQREVGSHTHSFAAALRATLRQDPNVILVGELRDLDTIAFTVTAAETGHLVFGTVHTVSAATTVDRLVAAFPPAKQDTVRAMLAESLRAVVCQHLLPRKDGQGRALAAEVMLNSDAVANVIRKGKSFQLPSLLATSREMGMQLMDADLMRLCKAGAIEPLDAYLKATNKKDFEPLLTEPGQPLPAAPVAKAS
jgi:twitching motility protein PilT